MPDQTREERRPRVWWVCRPVVWFAAASMMTTILHELAHASVALALDVRSTLFNYSAQIDLTPSQAGTNLLATIRIAGPVFSLMFGTAAWLTLRRARGSAAELPLLYVVVFGIGTFFGNLMSAAFVGDFSAAAAALQVPMTIRYVIAAAGGLSVAAIHFWAGRELVQWVPANVGRVAGMLGIIAAPVVLGTAAVIVVNQPLSGTTVNARIAEASFWLFAAIGALVTRRHGANSRLGPVLRWIDLAVLLVAIVIVRLMTRGIPFVP